MRVFSVLLFAIAISASGCKKDRRPVSNACDQSAVVDKEGYESIETENYSIIDASINGDCMQISFGASGCDGKSWQIELLDSGGVADALPQVRYIKLALVNNELCAAAIGRTISFDLHPLRISGVNKIRFVLADYDKSMIYEY